MIPRPLALLALLTAVSAPAAAQAAGAPGLTIAIDSVRREVVITAGPFEAPLMMESHHGGGDGMMDHGEAHDTPLQRFTWPTDAWLRGFAIEVKDLAGNPLPRRILHHLILVNFDRRQLLYNAAERIMGAGSETDDIALPKTIALPVREGTRLGLYAGWHNDTGREIDGVMLTLRLQWTPASQTPRPVAALPIYMDVNLTPGLPNSFDVPAGRSSKAHEFTMPVSGRLLGVSGHLHDYGVAVRLEDAATGRVLARVRAKREPDGKVTGIGRQLFGVNGEGLRLVAGRRYRVVGEYDNPTGQLRRNGAMAHLAGIFSPDDLALWPRIDEGDVDYQRDLAVLNMQGQDGGDHDHGSHDHP